MIGQALFSFNKTDWRTPRELFDDLNKRFHFGIDAAACAGNALCPRYYDENMDGLKMPWNAPTYVNPPYGRQIKQWVAKGSLEVSEGRCPLAVLLLPARTDTQWFHSYVYDVELERYYPGVQVIFLKGRIRFVGNKTNNCAPFPSMLVVFSGEYRAPR